MHKYSSYPVGDPVGGEDRFSPLTDPTSYNSLIFALFILYICMI